MTLYTIMPLETVLDGMQGDREPFHEIWVNGVYMQVTPVAPGMGKIVRLLQCSLNDYLDPQLTPGSMIMYGQTNPSV